MIDVICHNSFCACVRIFLIFLHFFIHFLFIYFVAMADGSTEEVSSSIISTMDITKLKVPELKKELKSRALSTSGNKNELVERLQAALNSTDTELGPAESIDDIEEDLLNDDDDEHIDERESLINDLESPDFDDIPKGQKRKSESEPVTGAPKKVILKRNTSDTLANLAKNSEEKHKETTEGQKSPSSKPSSDSEEKKVIKLSELSVKERLEMRAKKFGVTTLSDNAKKLARAERFGSSALTNSNSASSIKLNDPNTSIDVLKKRAERFGTSVSSLMSNIENKEKLEKRKERFGMATPATNGKFSSADEAKAARLERFKATVK